MERVRHSSLYHCLINEEHHPHHPQIRRNEKSFLIPNPARTQRKTHYIVMKGEKARQHKIRRKCCTNVTFRNSYIVSLILLCNKNTRSTVQSGSGTKAHFGCFAEGEREYNDPTLHQFLETNFCEGPPREKFENLKHG